jgi:ABC-type sugar transport system ATPase subunit
LAADSSKTTILKLIMGLEADAGRIPIDGRASLEKVKPSFVRPGMKFSIVFRRKPF